jgi:hypothetical protein
MGFWQPWQSEAMPNPNRLRLRADPHRRCKLLPSKTVYRFVNSQNEGVMKEVSIALLGAMFVLLSLMVLIASDPTPGADWTAAQSREYLSEMGLHYASFR